MSIMQTVLRTPHFEVISHVCQRPRVACGTVIGGLPARFIFTRRGSFMVHVGSRCWFARPGQAVFLGMGIEYHVTHPDAESCDCCTDVLISEEMLDMLGAHTDPGQPCRAFGHDLRFQKTHVELLRGLLRGGDADDAEEVLLDTLSYLTESYEAGTSAACGIKVMRQVTRVEEAIVGRAEENLGVEELAKVAGCSPFHLCRIFRACTGQSLRQFRMQQRLGSALGRLGDGERDLAALACDMGFNSHSHMTDAFRLALGMSPSEVRDDMRQSDLQVLKNRLRDVRGRWKDGKPSLAGA
ncbi:helix-turn-helix domain-containing protein [Dyella choica]|nr:AraC family transcriptional regulator [Dyella choica]